MYLTIVCSIVDQQWCNCILWIEKNHVIWERKWLVCNLAIVCSIVNQQWCNCILWVEKNHVISERKLLVCNLAIVCSIVNQQWCNCIFWVKKNHVIWERKWLVCNCNYSLLHPKSTLELATWEHGSRSVQFLSGLAKCRWYLDKNKNSYTS